MRIVKLIAGLAIVLAFSAVAVATASAAETLWRWLPGSAGETFTGRSAKATLQVHNAANSTITCAKSLLLLTFGTVSSELLENEAKLALGILHFETCTSGGIKVASEGDTSGIILVHLEIHNCLIKAGENGLLIKPLPLHIVFPTIPGLLILVRGAFIAKITSIGGSKLKYELTVAQAGGVQAIEKCEGGAKQTLESQIEGEKITPEFVESGEEAKEGALTFDMTKDASEEMMES